jgi:glutathione S-transferase
MKATLFGSRLSPFVEKVVRALHLKGLDYELAPVKTPFDFKKWNPQTQKMPVLDLDGERTYDSSRILRRLDEVLPEPPLFDRDPQIAARQRFLEDWSDEALYWYVMAFRWAAPNEDASAAQVAGSLPVPSVLLPILKLFVARKIKPTAFAQGLARLPFDVLGDELGRRLDELVVWLGDRPFFFADHPSGADLALFGEMSTIASGPTPQADALVNARPALVAWRKRVDAATQKPVERGRTLRLAASSGR